MSSSFRAIADLVVDNPIIMKDGVFALRRRKTILALALAAVGVVVGSALIWLDETAALRWAPDRPIGDGLMLAMFGIACVMAGVLVPATASSALAGEREHGTLPLLTVTGLSPGRIVVGKIAAILVLAAPFLALPVLPLVLGALSAGISFGAVVVALAGLMVAVVAFAAIGVYASSLTTRARFSAPAALLGAVVPSIVVVMPVVSLLTSTVEGHVRADDVMLALAGLVGGVVVAVAAAYGAWSNLAPRSAPRFMKASTLFVGVTVGLPMLAAAFCHVDWEGMTGLDARYGMLREPLFVLTFLFVSAATLLFAGGVGRDRSAPNPMLIVPPAVLIATVGFIGSFMSTELAVDVDSATRLNDGAQALTVWLHVIAAASAASLCGRLTSNTLLGAFLGGAITLVIILVPAIADEFISGRPPLAFLNFAYVRADDAIASVAFWSVFSGVALFFSRQRR